MYNVIRNKTYPFIRSIFMLCYHIPHRLSDVIYECLRPVLNYVPIPAFVTKSLEILGNTLFAKHKKSLSSGEPNISALVSAELPSTLDTQTFNSEFDIYQPDTFAAHVCKELNCPVGLFK